MQGLLCVQGCTNGVQTQEENKIILVTGAGGMLGEAVAEVFKEHKLVLTDINMVNTEREKILYLDVSQHSQVKEWERAELDLIIHLAAETDLERCEKYPSQAYMTNTIGTANMVELARRKDIPIVYISTAGVFDGEVDVYLDDDIPNPLNHYGRSKYYGSLICQQYDKAYILRAGFMMGGGKDKDKKFVNKIYKQIKEGAKEIFALEDVYGSPTYTYDLARTIKKVVLDNFLPGIYNCAGEGRASRYDVACKIVEFLGVDVKVTPVKMGYFRETFFCPRSKNETLTNIRLKKYGIHTMRPWEEALKEYITKDFI